MQVEPKFGELPIRNKDHPCSIKKLEPQGSHADSRRKTFWRQVHAIMRVISPHTVAVYAAITSRDNCFVLFTELLPGGDVRTLFKGSAEPLPVGHDRGIVSDVSAKIAFLHPKYW